MSSLIKDLGNRYFKDRFRHSMFMYEGQPHYIDTEASWSLNKVAAIKVMGPVEKSRTESVDIPHSFFTDFEVFKVPTLVWRMAAQGRILIHFARNHILRAGFRRGVAMENLRRHYAASSIFLERSGNISFRYYENAPATTKLIMCPEYMTYADGAKAMEKGDVVAFAISHNLAVLPDVGGAKSVMFNTNFAATITKDGEINCDSPIIEALIKESIK